MAFIQIMEFRTDRLDEVEAAVSRWADATEGRRTVRRSLLLRDRADQDHFLNVVFFDSYESAMENSGLPETDTLATEVAALFDDAPVFVDLDVVVDQGM
jgi:hypothetical protein